MRGKKSTAAEKELKGTGNPTRERKKAETNKRASPEVAEYLGKTKQILDLLWGKLNNPEIQSNAAELEKFSRLFIMWQKNYFSNLHFLPKEAKGGTDAISKMIADKKL